VSYQSALSHLEQAHTSTYDTHNMTSRLNISIESISRLAYVNLGLSKILHVSVQCVVSSDATLRSRLNEPTDSESDSLESIYDVLNLVYDIFY